MSTVVKKASFLHSGSASFMASARLVRRIFTDVNPDIKSRQGCVACRPYLCRLRFGDTRLGRSWSQRKIVCEYDNTARYLNDSPEDSCGDSKTRITLVIQLIRPPTVNLRNSGTCDSIRVKLTVDRRSGYFLSSRPVLRETGKCND